MVCDDDRGLDTDPDAFDLFHYIIQRRMNRGKLTVADSTALHDFARERLLDLARKENYETCLIVFNVSSSICIQRDKKRERQVGEKEIIEQDNLIQKALQDIHDEPWGQIHVLRENDAEVRFIL